MELKDISISALTRELLEVNGKSDCDNGIDSYAGWKEVAEGCGFDVGARSPAYEAYMDGYYKGTPPK